MAALPVTLLLTGNEFGGDSYAYRFVNAENGVDVTADVNRGVYSYDGTMIAFGVGNGDPEVPSHMLEVRDATTFAVIAQVSYPETPFSVQAPAIQWSPDGSYIAVKNAFGGGLRLISTSTWTQVAEGAVANSALDSFQWSPDSAYIYAGGLDGLVGNYIRRYNIPALTFTEGYSQIPGFTIRMRTCTVSHDGLYIAFKGSNDDIYVYNTTTKTRVAFISDGAHGEIVFSPTADVLYGTGLNGSALRAWAAGTWSEIGITPPPGNGEGSGLGISPDGLYVGVGLNYGGSGPSSGYVYDVENDEYQLLTSLIIPTLISLKVEELAVAEAFWTGFVGTSEVP